jgi:D-alanine-D-alanine ligase
MAVDWSGRGLKVVVFLYTVPGARTIDDPSEPSDIHANFESEESIGRLLDHFREYVPEIVGTNIHEPGWIDKIDGRKVFNYTYGFGLLSESVWPTMALEGHRVTYFGARPSGIYLSSNKPHCSEIMMSLGFRCPRQKIVCKPLSLEEAQNITAWFDASEHLVLKPAYEESSVGLALVPNSPAEVCSAVTLLYETLPGPQVLQEYIDGVDVTVPIIGRKSPRCLPAVALVRDIPSTDPFVFDAGLKATKSSVHYEETSEWPDQIRSELYRMAVAAYLATEQRDYSRLDCRVTPDGRCYFIEVNANPQIGLGKASFAVSAGIAGIDVGEVFRSIVDDNVARLPPSPMVSGR